MNTGQTDIAESGNPLTTPGLHYRVRSRHVVWIAGLFSIALGTLVVIGWHAHLRVLVQIDPSWAPMQYNAALSFVLLGASLMVSTTRRAGYATVPAIAGGMLAVATLLEYALNRSFGIDELFLTHYVSVQTSHPGRMAPNTALCFLLASVALIGSGPGARARRSQALTGILGGLVFCFSAVPAVGYVSGVDTAYGWGSMTRMAMHTAVGLLVVGAGLIALAINRRRVSVIASAWLSPVVGLSYLAITLGFWQAMVALEHRNLGNAVDAASREFRRELETAIHERIVSMERMAGTWRLRGGVSREVWAFETRLFQRRFPDVVAIEPADDLMVFRESEFQSGPGSAADLDQNAWDRQLKEFDGAGIEHKYRGAKFSNPIHAGRDFLLHVPIGAGRDHPSFLVAVLAFNKFFGQVTERFEDEFHIRISDGDREIFSTLPLTESSTPMVAAAGKRTRLNVAGIQWWVTVSPRESIVSGARSALPSVFLACNTVIALFLALVVFLAQASSRNASKAGAVSENLRLEVGQRKLAELRLERLNADLEERVAERTMELERTIRDLDQFTFMASHDLQEPLRKLQMFASALEEETGAVLSDAARHSVRAIGSGAARMRELVQDLLDLARARNHPLSLRHTNLHQLLEDVVDELSIPVEESGSTIVFNGLPDVQCDPVLISQVFQNLLSNAIKFRRDDALPRIEVSSERLGGEHIITFTDNGIGVDSASSSAIFLPFKRLNSRKDYEGTGIGLATCKKIVERHGGRIWVEPLRGGGSAFKFTLPVLPIVGEP